MTTLTAKIITKKSHEYEIIKNLYNTQFPTTEKLPMWILLWKAKHNGIDFLAFFDGNQFVGFTYLVTKKDLTLIFYLAVNDKIQSKGYGSRILKYISELYPNNRLTLNIEELNDKSPNHLQREKRRRFYLKNNYIGSGISLIDSGVSYEVLIANGKISIPEYHEVYRKFAGAFFYPLFKPELILESIESK